MTRPLAPLLMLLVLIPLLCAHQCDDSGASTAAMPEDTADGGSDAPIADSGIPTTDTDNSDDAATDDPEGVEIPIVASDGYKARQAEFLAFCIENNAPGSGSVYGQSCRVAAGETEFHQDVIDASIAHIEERRDTSDFRANALVRVLYLNNTTRALDETLAQRIEKTLLEFKYWIDEPGEDGMAYWTENHQILFHTAELLIGQRLPETTFPNSGMTGAEHAAHARPRIERWLNLRGRYGFSEWHSNVYFNEDIPALLNLVDFAEDDVIRTKASMVLDIIALDLLHNMYKGVFATTHGRTYPNKWLGDSSDSTREAAWIMLGLGEYKNAGNFGAAFLATSSYVPPPILERLAAEVAPRQEHRQRDSFDVKDGSEAGVSYEGLDDVVVWAGLSAIVAPDVIDGSMNIMEEFDLWDGFLFGSLPDDILNLVRSLIGTPQLRQFAEGLTPLAVGIALEGVDTYVYRTPHYQLAGAQQYKPGMWGAQTLMWRATLDAKTSVLTTSPGIIGIGDIDDINFNDAWQGGWYPRTTLHQNVGVIRYSTFERAPSLLDQYISNDYTHAYFPRSAFDEVVERNGWIMGRKDEGYVALWSQNPMVASEENDYELRVEGPENIYIIEMGSIEEHTSFEVFVDAIAEATVDIGPESSVRYTSPTAGLVEVDGVTGAMKVADTEVDLGPYARWDNPYTQQTSGTDKLDVILGDETLRLDFASGTRRLFSKAE